MNLVFKIGANRKVYLLYCKRLFARPTSKSVYRQVPKNIVADNTFEKDIEKYPNFMMNSSNLIDHRLNDLQKSKNCTICKANICTLI